MDERLAISRHFNSISAISGRCIGANEGLTAMEPRLRSAVKSAIKWEAFSNQEWIRQRKERGGLCLSYAVPKIQWDSITPRPQRPPGYRKPLALIVPPCQMYMSIVCQSPT